MTTRSTRTPSSSSVVANRSWVSGRSGRQALELHRDRARLPRPDPDREVAVAVGLLEDHHVPAGEHVDPDALDDHLDQLVVRHRPIIPRPPAPAAVPGRPPMPRQRGAPRRPPPRTRRCGRRTPRRRRSGPCPSEVSPSISWRTNQNPSTMTAGHVDQLVEEAEEDERRDPGPREEHEVRAEGRGDRARTPRSSGSSRSGSMATWASAGGDAAGEVEEQEPRPAQAVLDVVREDPQVEQVAEQVEPAAVQELAGDERRGLLRQEVAASPGRGELGRDDAPARDERSSAASPPLAVQPELPGEDDEAGDDDRRSSRPASGASGWRRAAGSSDRSGHGFLVGLAVASAVRVTAASDGLRRRRRHVGDGLEESLVDGVLRQPHQRRRRVLDAGRDRNRAQVRPSSGASPASRYWPS